MARDEQLAALWAAGASDDDIAAAMNKTPSAVKSRAARLRLGSRDRSLQGRPTSDGKLYWTAEEDRRLLELRQQGKKMRDIAEALGRSAGGVHCRLEKLAVQNISRGVGAIRRCMRAELVSSPNTLEIGSAIRATSTHGWHGHSTTDGEIQELVEHAGWLST
jgi:DNA-binding NarL/FixJ family response regulator